MLSGPRLRVIVDLTSNVKFSVTRVCPLDAQKNRFHGYGRYTVASAPDNLLTCLNSHTSLQEQTWRTRRARTLPEIQDGICVRNTSEMTRLSRRKTSHQKPMTQVRHGGKRLKLSVITKCNVWVHYSFLFLYFYPLAFITVKLNIRKIINGRRRRAAKRTRQVQGQHTSVHSC